MGSISNYGECKSIDASLIPLGAWILDLEDIEKDTGKVLSKKTSNESKSSKHCFKVGQVLYSKLRPYLNKVVIADEDGYCTSEIIPFDVYGGVNTLFVQLFLMSPGFVANAMEESYGVKMPRLGTEDARNAFVPIPPVNEQRRIVERYHMLLPYIDEYGTKESNLSQLNTSLPSLLKKSILQEAIQGKLVPQDPNDEPASVLLERIRKEKARLVKEGKLKPDKHDHLSHQGRPFNTY